MGRGAGLGDGRLVGRLADGGRADGIGVGLVDGRLTSAGSVVGRSG
jgi:hypothetical protein